MTVLKTFIFFLTAGYKGGNKVFLSAPRKKYITASLSSAQKVST